MRAHLDLSPELIRSIAKGDPANLPRFMVHDDDVWPWGNVQLDIKRRIHLRRTDFNTIVAPQIPCVPGLWHRDDLQEFHVKLRADQLHGDGSTRVSSLAEVRAITKDDRKCPECGGWMHDLHSSPGARFCLSCAYGHSSPDAPNMAADELRRLGARGLL